MKIEIDIETVKELIEIVYSQHPYKEIGNRESYSQYNEGWTDGIGSLESQLLNYFDGIKNVTKQYGNNA